MSITQALNQTQRKQFMDQLYEVSRNAGRTLSEKSAEARKVALRKLLEQQGVLELIDNFTVTKENLDLIEKQIEEKGFEVHHNGEVDITHGAPEAVTAAFEAFIDEQIGPEKQKVEKAHEAIRSSWSIATLPEAKQLLATLAQ